MDAVSTTALDLPEPLLFVPVTEPAALLYVATGEGDDLWRNNPIPREAPKVQGSKTKEQQRRIVNKDEVTSGSDVPSPNETLKHASKRSPKPGPGNANEISSGDRSIQRGANDPGPHDKKH